MREAPLNLLSHDRSTWVSHTLLHLAAACGKTCSGWVLLGSTVVSYPSLQGSWVGEEGWGVIWELGV